MLTQRLEKEVPVSGVSQKLLAYFQLLKFRLSLTIAFSCAIGFMLGSSQPNWFSVLMVMVGGLLVTGSANIINQIIEKDFDMLMKRTARRPLPTGTLSVTEAAVFCALVGVMGIGLMAVYFNVLSAALSLVSLILYGFLYTPLKRISPICVFVGAFPGAFPPLIGWVAATGAFSPEAWVLFGIQFFWQFPHFWAIAWVLDDDYKKAGFKMLPMSGGKNLKTAFQIMTYTLLLIPLGMLPMQLGLTGSTSAIIAVICGVVFLMQTLYLMRTCTKKAAMSIMFGSFLYLPIVQIALVLDKIPQ